MSFDTEFVYTPISNYIGNCVVDITDKITTLDEKISMLSNASNVYAHVTQTCIYDTTLQRNCLQNNANAYVEIQSELDVLGNLSNDDKSVLYDFYTTHFSGNKRCYMAKMLYNTTELLPDIRNIMIDDPPSEGSANIIIGLISDNHRVKLRAKSICFRLTNNGVWRNPQL